MDNSRYRIFCEALRLGSFTKAADALGCTQSAVSQSVQALERELGFTLVKRRKGRIELTRDGESLFPFIQRMRAAEVALERKKREMKGLQETVIRIGTFTSISRNFLPPVIASFRARYPGARFILQQGSHSSIPEWLEEESVDLGFINTDMVTGFETLPLYRDRFLAVLPKGHPLAGKESVALAELALEHRILLDDGRSLLSLDAFARAGLHVKADFEIYDDYTVIELIRRGMGVSLLYEHFLAPFLGDVETRPIAEDPGRNIALAWRNWNTLPYASKLFVEAMKQALQRRIGSP